MARKKSLNDLDNDPIIPNDDTELDESSIFEEEEDDSEDKGIDEILGGATLGRAAGDLDGWGSSVYEDYLSCGFSVLCNDVHSSGETSFNGGVFRRYFYAVLTHDTPS